MKFLLALVPAMISGLRGLLGQIIAALGLTAVSYVGMDMLIERFKTEIMTALSAVPAGMLQLFYLAGGGVILNIFFGCLAFAVSFKTLTKIVPRIGQPKP